MRVCQINCVYKSGSTGKIVYAIHQHLQETNNESFVIYGNGLICNEKNVFKAAPEFVRKAQSLRSRITGYAYAGCIYSTWRIITMLKRIKPDVVHLHCVNAYMVNIYSLLIFLKQQRVKTVLTLHAEFMYTAGCSHSLSCEKWKTGCCKCPQINKLRPKSWFFDRSASEWHKMENAFHNFDTLIVCAVSDWVKDRAKQSPFFQNKKVITVLNGLDTDVFQWRDTVEMRRNMQLENIKVVLHVTPNFRSAIKGGVYVLELAQRFEGEPVVFIVLGANYKSGKLPCNMLFIPHINDQLMLAKYYAMADVCLLTSQRETFSMVCAESLCCGTPIVGFEAGGPETISLRAYSEFVPQGNLDMLESALRHCLESKTSAVAIQYQAHECYNRNRMYDDYLRIYMKNNNVCY